MYLCEKLFSKKGQSKKRDGQILALKRLFKVLPHWEHFVTKVDLYFKSA
jgi:hypothetical protein